MTFKLTPYFKLQGNAKEVIQYYKEALGAKVIHMQKYGEMPIPFPDDLKDQIAHGMVQIGESLVMFSDSPDMPVQTGDNLTISLSTESADEATRIFNALQQDGQIIAPLEETPFSPAFGTVKDKFGFTFTIVVEQHE